MKQPNAFDDLIRQRIDELPPGPARGWDALASRLDAGAAAADPSATDSVVADKLSSLSPLPPAGSWEVFAKKLATAEAATVDQVDELVSTGLRQSAPATVSGWALLAARLETIGKRREMVGCMKVTEAAFLLSMLLLYVQFAPTTIDTQGVATAPSVAAADEVEAVAPNTSPATLPTSTESSTAIQADNREISKFSRDASRVTRVAVLPALPLHDRRVVSQSTFVPGGDPAVPRTALTVGTEPVVEPRRLTTAPQPALELPLVEHPEPIRYYINAFVSPVDVNQIVTKEDLSLGIYDQSALSTGYSAGVLVDVMQGKNGIQTGVFYGYRSYVPAEILRLQRFRSVEVEGKVRYGRLRYHTVSIPLNYERVISRTDNWQVTLGVGAAANLILSSEFRLQGDYTLQDLERQIAEFRELPLVKSRAGLKSFSNDAGRRDILYPNAGALEGGSLVDNTGLYLSSHLRVERLLDSRWSLYFSPTVSRLFTLREGSGGKGPLQDRIHNAMFRVGTRYRLTGK